MALPTQVQVALDAAEATLAATNGQPPSTESTAEPALDAQPQPDPFGDAPQPQAAPVEPPAPQQRDVWEERYKSLQGLFNQQVPQLQQQVKGLQSNLDEAINRLNLASEKRESTPVQPQAASTQDVDNFGQDLVDMVSRIAGASVAQAARVFDAKVASFEVTLNQLQQNLQGTSQQVAQTVEQKFFDDVTRQVPDWEQVNVDPAFLAWLAEVDPVYGAPRQAALERAQQSLNAQHAAAVFNAFKSTSANKPVKPKASLVEQVSPRSVATVQPTSREAAVITQKQIVAFYDEARRGAYRGNEAEYTRIENMINAAIAEGRVR